MATKLNTVEVLRGVAALSVTWFHLTNTYPHNLVSQSGSYGWLGVECFFVISGFIIPYALQTSSYQTSQFLRFMARRLVRLEPPYLVSIVLVIALGYLSVLAPGFRGTPPHFSFVQVSQHFLYLVPLFQGEWLNVVYWTLAYEFAFYILTGLLFSLLWPRSILWTMLVVLCASALVPTADHYLNSLVLLFMVGISTARYFVARDSLKIYLFCLTATLAVIVFNGDAIMALVGGASALALAFIRVPRLRPLSGLATISYSLYLIHVPVGGRVVNLGGRFGSGTLFDLGLSLVALLVSLTTAWLLYKLVERPATALSKRISLKRKPDSAGELAVEIVS